MVPNSSQHSAATATQSVKCRAAGGNYRHSVSHLWEEPWPRGAGQPAALGLEGAERRSEPGRHAAEGIREEG